VDLAKLAPNSFVSCKFLAHPKESEPPQISNKGTCTRGMGANSQ